MGGLSSQSEKGGESKPDRNREKKKARARNLERR
nr:MAG TPA: hypothetical protein [Caudoviricetes sp.]